MHTVYLILMSVGEYWQRVNFVKTDFREGLVDGLLDSKESLTCVTDISRDRVQIKLMETELSMAQTVTLDLFIVQSF